MAILITIEAQIVPSLVSGASSGWLPGPFAMSLSLWSLCGFLAIWHNRMVWAHLVHFLPRT